MRLDAPEWDPLFAYAESQGISAPAAARELLLTALATSANDAIFLAAARNARHEIQKIAYQAAARAMRMAWDEIAAKAASLGFPTEGL